MQDEITEDIANARDSESDAAIHFLAKRKGREDIDVKTLLLRLLMYSKADINLQDAGGRTALHSAAEVSILYIVEHVPIGGFC